MHSTTLVPAAPAGAAAPDPVTEPRSGARRTAALRDPAGWDRLVRRHGRRMVGAVRRILRRTYGRALPEDVDDLVQEVWYRLIERCGPGLGPLGGLDDARTSAYLVRAARNAAADRVRREAAVKRGRGWLRSDGFGEADEAELFPDPAPDPEDRLLARERRLRFRALCRRLATPGRRGARDATIAERALVDGWSSRRIARSLGGELTPSSVDSVVHRMRTALAAAGYDLPRRQNARNLGAAPGSRRSDAPLG